jgi:hydroxymethylpyrimidine pyrophosphatase-like HAD family hydrolase
MPFRLIALDLDGTLIDTGHGFGPGAAEAIAACEARGARVVLATGRSFTSAAPYARDLRLRDTQITLNGAVVAEPATGELTARARLSREQVAAVVDELARRDIPYSLFGRDRVYAERGTPGVPLLDRFGEPPPVWLSRDEIVAHPEPIKLLVSLRRGPLDAELAAALGGTVDVVRSGELFFEFMPRGVSKGDALAELMRRHGVPPAETLAIGDGENDLSMFAVAGHSVAMGQANAAVRAAATEVTATCAEGGVALALRRLVL